MRKTISPVSTSRVRTQRLRLLPLAARAALALSASAALSTAHAITYQWFGGLGQFSSGTNWTPGGVPGPTDTASIGAGQAVFSGSQTVGGLALSSGATLRAGSGATFAVQGSHQINGVLSGGVINLLGTGSLSGVQLTDGTTVNNHQSSSLGDITLGSGSTLTNLSGATLTLVTAIGTSTGNDALISNAGTLNVVANRRMEVPLINTGTVSTSANLTLARAGSHTGSFVTNDPNANLIFERAQSFSASSTLSGSGTVSFLSGAGNGGTARPAVVVDGSFSARSLQVVSVALSMAQDTVLTGYLTTAGDGEISLAGSLTLNADSAFGTYQLGASRLLQQSTINLNRDGTVAGFTLSDNSTLNSSGRMALDQLNFASSAAGGATFNNLSGGVVTLKAAASYQVIGASDGVSSFNNAGTLVFQNGAASPTVVQTFGVRMNNSGTIALGDAGRLVLNAGGTHTGQFTGSGSSRLTFGHGDHTIASGASISLPNSTLAFTGGSWGSDVTTLNGSASAASVQLGTAADVVLNGQLTSLALTVDPTARLRGVGTVHNLGSFVNHGVLAPGATAGDTGTLTVDGDIALASDGKLQFDLASLVSFDTLAITGTAALGGTIELLGAGYTPVVGDSFLLLTMGSRAPGSTFSGLVVSGLPDAVFDVIYSAQGVQVTVAAVVPEPATWALWAAGVLAIAARQTQRRRTRETV